MLHSIFQSDAAPDEEILRQADYNLSREPNGEKPLRERKISIRLINYVTRRIEISLKVRKPVRGRRSRNDLTAVSCIIRGLHLLFRLTAARQGLFRVEPSDLQSNMIFSVYRGDRETTSSGSRQRKWRFEGIRERKEEIMSRTWSNSQDRKCSLSTPIIGISFPRFFFFWLNRSRSASKKERARNFTFIFVHPSNNGSRLREGSLG